MKSAIISGASGFIGTHLCRELINNNVDVIGLARRDGINICRLPQEVQIEWIGMDDYEKYDGRGADVFFHLAWEGATGTGRADENLQAKNVSRTINAMKAAKRVGCKRFVALGTVYENLVPQILNENEHRKVDFYLLSKQSTHYMCLQLAKKLDMEFVWATIFQPIGRYIKKEQVMTYAISGMINGEPPEFGPAMEPYNITAVENVAYGLRLLGECPLSKNEYFIGSGKSMIMKDYLFLAREILGVNTKLKIGARPDDGLRFSFDWYSIDDIVKDTGYSERISYEKAVQNVAEWIKEDEF